MASAHSTKTPAEQGPVQIKEEEVLSTLDTMIFRPDTGSLLHLSRCTRPGLAHALMVLDENHVNTRSESDDQDEKGFKVPERYDFDWTNLQ